MKIAVVDYGMGNLHLVSATVSALSAKFSNVAYLKYRGNNIRKHVRQSIRALIRKWLVKNVSSFVFGIVEFDQAKWLGIILDRIHTG